MTTPPQRVVGLGIDAGRATRRNDGDLYVEDVDRLDGPVSSTSDRRPHRRLPLAVVLSGWPRVSETFAINDLLAMRRAGLLGPVFATKPGDRAICQPSVAELDAHVAVIPDGTVEEQAAFVARALHDTPIAGVHGYFAHRPAAVAQVAAARLGVPFGFGAHALDARKVAPVQLRRMAAQARVVLACNADVAATLRTCGAEPQLVSHGVDTARFRPVATAARPGLRVLAVGRLVEKKGFDVLVGAIRLLDPDVRLTIVGEGPERGAIEEAVARHVLVDRVELRGAVTHESLPADYAAADIVVVPSRVDRRADRDGLPNVVLEAMAAGRPIVASDVAAIGSMLRDGVTGVLVAPDDPSALAAEIGALRHDPQRRRRLGAEARRAVVAGHSLRRCGHHLAVTLQAAYG